MGRVGKAILASVLAAVLMAPVASLSNVPTPENGSLNSWMSCPGTGAVGRGSPDPAFLVKFHNRQFTPEPRLRLDAIRAAAVGERAHYLLQVCALPAAAERLELAASGIDLVGYVAGNAYIASSRVADLGALRENPLLRHASPLDPLDKISTPLARGEIGPWADAWPGRAALTVQLHGDVDPLAGLRIADAFAAETVVLIPAIPAVSGVFPLAAVGALAALDEVQFVSVMDPPLEEHNDGARPASNVATINAVPYGLTGAGVTVLVYDSGIADNAHPDFGARLIQLEAGETVRSHSTHVAGTVGGSGANSAGTDTAGTANGGTANQWAGMATAVNIRSFGSPGQANPFYDTSGDLNADFTTAIGNGIDLATMSLGNNVVTNGFPCAQLGDYVNAPILLDNIVRGSIAGQQLIYFESAGNERQSGAPCGQFSTISTPATAKNTIAVGAINSNDNSITGFTSYGPTDDGRLKPDIVGPGCQSTGDGGITSTDFVDADGDGNLGAGEAQASYSVKCGTSMSTPVAAGTGALLIQQWQSTRGAGTRPLGHTMKAILIHTATDLGNAGPDYRFGHGALNAQAAADLIIADDTEDRIFVDSVDNGDTDFYTFNSDGSGAVQVTAVWSDPAAARLAAVTLINDLDLRLTDPDGVVYQPWVLNPAIPANAATTGNDNRNNVEVVVGNAKAGTWTVSVAGTAVPSGPQQYSLITPEDAVLNRPPVADADGPYVTPEGTDVALDATGSSDPDGDALTYAWDFDADDAFDDAVGASPTFDLVGQDGVFPVAVRVTDANGAFDTDASTVTVTNVAPSVVAASDAPEPEGGTVTVTGTGTDPGWLDLLTATVDWDDGTPPAPAAGVLENVRPDATLAFSASHVYGDNGAFVPEVCVADDDTSTCVLLPAVVITNVDPTAEIDESGAVLVNGIPTIIAHAGDTVTFRGRSTDPGSDDLDLRWDWDDGAPAPDVTTTYLVNPPFLDPLPSPTVQPRDVTDEVDHAFADACLYEVGFSALDDDGGSASDSVNVIIVGNGDKVRHEGWWQDQFRAVITGNGFTEFDAATLECYLEIVQYMSTVFSEARDVSSLAAAFDGLFMAHNGGSELEQLDRLLLTVWLNFANGVLSLDDFLDSPGSGPDGTFADLVYAAESVRLDPTATDGELREQRGVLLRILAQLGP